VTVYLTEELTNVTVSLYQMQFLTLLSLVQQALLTDVEDAYLASRGSPHAFNFGRF